MMGKLYALETKGENANNMREIFEIVRRKLEKASQDQARI